MWYVGQPVICIESDWVDDWPNTLGIKTTSPIKGERYHIREIFEEEGEIYFYLEEIHSLAVEEQHWCGEVGFAADGFRPIVERSTDISCFEALLNVTPVMEL